MAEWKATPEQQAAAQDRGGALLVAAAAGSGKTKVLVDRLMGYLTDPDDPADLDEFLIITYTRAAAAELRGKIAARLGEMLAEDPDNKHLQRQLTRVYLAQISTVHAFCQTVLRQYAAEADLPADFRVADEQQAAVVVGESRYGTSYLPGIGNLEFEILMLVFALLNQTGNIEFATDGMKIFVRYTTHSRVQGISSESVG